MEGTFALVISDRCNKSCRSWIEIFAPFSLGSDLSLYCWFNIGSLRHLLFWIEEIATVEGVKQKGHKLKWNIGNQTVVLRSNMITDTLDNSLVICINPFRIGRPFVALDCRVEAKLSPESTDKFTPKLNVSTIIKLIY